MYAAYGNQTTLPSHTGHVNVQLQKIAATF